MAENNVISEEGEFTVNGKDIFENNVDGSISFKIDKTAPVFEFTSNEENVNIINWNTSANSSVIKVKDDNIDEFKYVYNDGNETVVNADNVTITNVGTYAFSATDKAGNVASQMVVIESKPEISTSPLMTNNQKTKDSITVDITKGVLKVNGEEKAAPFTVSDDGVHIISAEDEYGSKTLITFTVDKTAPTFAVKSNDENIKILDSLNNGSESVFSDNLYTSSGSINISTSDSDITKKVYVVDGVENNIAPDGNIALSSDKEYEIKISDDVGNEKTCIIHTFEKPDLSVVTEEENPVTLVNGDFVNKSVRISASPVDTAKAYKGENEIQGVITDDGRYNIYAKDIFGASSDTITFTIDKTSPVMTLASGEDGVNILDKNGLDSLTSKEDELYTSSHIINVSVNEDNLDTLEYKLDSGTSYTPVKDEKIVLNKGDAGIYEIKATDKAGNTSVKTINVYDKPEYNIEVLNSGTFNNHNATNESVKISVIKGSDTLLSIKKDEKDIVSDITDTTYTLNGEDGKESEYTVALKDKYGNKAENTSFIIDKKNPVALCDKVNDLELIGEIRIKFDEEVVLDASSSLSVKIGEESVENPLFLSETKELVFSYILAEYNKEYVVKIESGLIDLVGNKVLNDIKIKTKINKVVSMKMSPASISANFIRGKTYTLKPPVFQRK